MTVLVPYAPGMLHEQTREWAETGRVPLVKLERDDHAYWRFLAAEWATPGDMLVVEQDIVPATGVAWDMLDCRRPWCASPYRIAHSWLDEGLGCIKLAGRLKDRHPDLMERLGEMTGDGLPARDWRRLDVRLARLLRNHGYAPHAHRRSVHLHDYQARP